MRQPRAHDSGVAPGEGSPKYIPRDTPHHVLGLARALPVAAPSVVVPYDVAYVACRGSFQVCEKCGKREQIF
jgi:hypothetical protein